MSQTTSIEWTEVTWNPVHGCSKVSPGCAHCYAETLSRRYGFTQRPWTPANAAENVVLKPHKLAEPLRWRKPRMVFVNSMSDLFHERVPDEYIARVFAVMADASKHTFQVLTKRPERAKKLLGGAWIQNEIDGWTQAGIFSGTPWPLPNVWLGVSIENRRFVHRADLLRETPAAIRFISAEPLLGPLFCGENDPPWLGSELSLRNIDWLIIGGESGPQHRTMDLQWARDLVMACRCYICGGAGRRSSFVLAAHGEIEGECPDCHGTGWLTAPFVKQLGGARPGTRLESLPEDLRIREFPERAA